MFLRIRDGERLCWEGSLGPCYENGGLAADADSLTPTSVDWPDLWSVLRCIPEPFVDSAEQTAEDAVIAQFRTTILLERSSDGKVAKLVKDVEFIERESQPGTTEQVHVGEIRIATGSGPPESLELMMQVRHDADAPVIDAFALVHLLDAGENSMAEFMAAVARLEWE